MLVGGTRWNFVVIVVQNWGTAQQGRKPKQVSPPRSRISTPATGKYQNSTGKVLPAAGPSNKTQLQGNVALRG